MSKSDRLARAKRYLAIAESKDAKREAYKAAAREIIAYKAETRESDAAIAIALGGNRSGKWVETLRRWEREGFKSETPFLADGKATTRAGVSHTKKVLREHSTEEIKEILDDLPDEAVEKIAEATEGTRITRALYPDRPKPSHRKATERAKARDTENLKQNQQEAVARVGSACGSARASIRALVKQYEEFVAIVDDEEFREMGREMVVGLRADADLALGEVLEGSYDEALGRLLSGEVG